MMLRAAAVIACAVLASRPAPGAAQQQRWFVTVNGGYANGIGDTFEEGGSVSAAGFIYRSVARNVDLGLEFGYHGLGTGTTRIQDLYGPGSTYREDFAWSAWQSTAAARFRPAASRARPYAALGAGVYTLRSRDVIEVRDAAGQPIPQYQFRQTNADLYPGINAGLGVDRLVSFGRLGLGVHARWHGIIAAAGIADFFSIGVGVALD